MAKYSYEGIELNPVRLLSETERTALDKAIDAIKRLRRNKAIQRIEAQAALDIILCAEPIWHALASQAVKATLNAKDDNTRIGMQLRVEGMIIGLTEVFEVRYDMHSGELIANNIDNATRNPFRDAVPGAFNYDMAMDVITKAYSKNADADTNAKR